MSDPGPADRSSPSTPAVIRRRIASHGWATLLAFLLPLVVAATSGWSQSTTRPAMIANPPTRTVEPAESAPATIEEKVAGHNDATPIRRSEESSAVPVPRAKSGAGGSGVSGTRVAVALGIVLLLIFGLRWAARGMFPGAGIARANRAIQVVSRTVISPKQQLMLVQVGRRLVMVGDCGAQMNALCEITDPDEVAALLGQVQAEKSEPAARRFRTLFGKAEQKFDANIAAASNASENSIATARATVHDGALDDDHQDNGVSDPALGTTREELSGLMEKVRLLSNQFRRT